VLAARYGFVNADHNRLRNSGLPLQRPRRIFRGSRLGVPGLRLGALLHRGLLAGVACVGVGGVALLFGLPSDLFGRAPVPAGAVTAEPQQVAVVDGGTLRLHDTVVRLNGVAAPARGRTCADGQGAGYDCGAAASAALAELVRDHRVACKLSGHDRAGLAQGVCEAGGTELNRALVAAGWARADIPGLGAVEATARADRLGLWRNGADPSF
jgi:endonuclease YncB( thermonuclease family)